MAATPTRCDLSQRLGGTLQVERLREPRSGAEARIFLDPSLRLASPREVVAPGARPVRRGARLQRRRARTHLPDSRPLGDSALLTITGNEPDRDWDHGLHRFTRDFQILSYHLHNTILRTNGVGASKISLSPRETECLTWVSRGKTVWETATILSISERTVRFYLDLARHKLNATNITHTVARAIASSLIPAPASPRLI